MVYVAGARGPVAPAVEALFGGYFEQGLNLCELSDVVARDQRYRVEGPQLSSTSHA